MAGATRLEVFRGVVVPVASLGHLVALKLLAVDDRRPQDRMDLVALRRQATDQDRSVADRAVQLISERGFHRGRDLEAALERWWSG